MVPTRLSLPENDPTLFIVIVSIVGGVVVVCAIVVGVITLTRIAVRHRERMARIGMGIDPDSEEPLSNGSFNGSSAPIAPPAGRQQFTGTRSPAPRDV
jgi:hypothetical protein